MRTVLISDLHLTPDRQDIAQAFFDFLHKTASGADRLYILGDFFEYWLGDDTMDAFALQVAAALRNTSRYGTRVFLLHGNRDFLIGEAFCRQANCTLIPDPTKIELGGQPVLLMHGDTLCTDDVRYLRYRRIVRNSLVQKLFLASPAVLRRSVARSLRRNSSSAHSRTERPVFYDVTSQAVDAAMGTEIRLLIHGHVHRAATYDLNGGRQRLVLGDWDKEGWYILHSHEGLFLKSFPIAATSSVSP